MQARLFRSSTPLAVAFLILAGVEAGAQYTPFVAHPRRAPDTTRARPAETARADSARRPRGSAARRAEIANMKAWVDSAAIAAGTRIPLPVDTTRRLLSRHVETTFVRAAAPVVGGGTPRIPTRDSVPRMIEREPSEVLLAPDTASSLPALLVGGLVATLAGLARMRRR